MRNLARALCLCLVFAAGAASRAADFDIDTLSGRIDAGSVQTVEQALAALPASMRANYTLVFASRSLQDATFSAPRVILYGTDGRFIVTFNGDASERGFGVLETMQFDERSNSFHFRELSFASAGQAVQISEDNPARCVACHGRPARPIWDTPPSWPGVYGERYRSGLSKAEAAGMQVFLAHQAADPRYQYLIGARRLADRATYVASAHALYNGERYEPPNARLSVLLGTLNVRSIVSELSERPAFQPHRFVLLAAAEGDCGAVKSFFPAALQPAIERAMAAYEQSSALADAGQEATKRYRRVSTTEGYRGGFAANDPVALRFIAEQLVGLPRQRWSLALERDSYDLAAPDGALSLEQLLFDKLAVSEPELRDLGSYRSFTGTDAYCTGLRRRSERELTAFYDATGIERLRFGDAPATDGETLRPRLFDSCIACHRGGVGPVLPFGDTAALIPRLTVGAYPHGRLLDEILFRLTPQAGAARMPRGINPSPAEQRELEDYFVGLAQAVARNGQSAAN
jgi:hypothetical protein